jgi:hypothetical protein
LHFPHFGCCCISNLFFAKNEYQAQKLRPKKADTMSRNEPNLNCVRPSRPVAFLVTSMGLALLGLVNPLSAHTTTVIVQPRAGGEGIQKALDHLRKGGEILLQPGTYVVRQPILLRHPRLSLRGAGSATILLLADKANCPVVILGNPIDNPSGPTTGLHLSDLVIDGNRANQQQELWRSLPDGGVINNNGIGVWNADGVTVEHVVCCRCRSGGMVTSAGTRHLTVRDFTAFDNQFDGLACYLTEDSHFSQLSLHDNRAAGLSLDLSFNHNVIDGAVLAGNDLGVFMRQSRDNTFQRLTIEKSRHHGVFMAQTAVLAPSGWRLCPGTECTGNSFDKLLITGCGGKAFVVNDDSCKNNVIDSGQFFDNAQGGLSQARTNPVTVRALVEQPTTPSANSLLPAPVPSQKDTVPDAEDLEAM